ncbi:MAG: M56 family metallopeptidase [Actinomycetota bacterium]
MTLAALALAWIGLAILVRPPRTFLGRLEPRTQAVAALTATLGLALIPISFSLAALYAALSASGGVGLQACGRLVWAILTDPIARPDLSLALGVVAATPLAVARGVASSWRSQSASRALAQRGHGPVLVIATLRPVAFTVGLLRPRVVVSRGLMSRTRSEFRGVVLAHEEAHRRGRHPLLLFIGESAAKALPLAPLRWGADTLRFALESLADDRAVRHTGSRELVAETVASVALASVGGTAGFEGDEVRRVRRLLASDQPAPLRGLLVVAGLFAVLAFAGGHTAHCATEGAQILATSQCRLH